MKENYEVYEDLYERLYTRLYEEAGLVERLTDIQEAVEGICGLLERFVEYEEGRKEEKKEKEGKVAEFRLSKIGVDIGEEKCQAGAIARIFGNA